MLLELHQLIIAGKAVDITCPPWQRVSVSRSARGRSPTEILLLGCRESLACPTITAAMWIPDTRVVVRPTVLPQKVVANAKSALQTESSLLKNNSSKDSGVALNVWQSQQSETNQAPGCLESPS